MRYPLRNRTPLSAMNAMKNLGVLGVSPGRYIPPSAVRAPPPLSEPCFVPW